MDLICVDHLTNGEQDTAAVTIWNGFAVCAAHAKQRDSIMEAGLRSFRS